MAAHLDEQEEWENFKYFWRRWGRWLFAVLLMAALAYLAQVIYQQHQSDKKQQAATVLVQIKQMMQREPDNAQAISAALDNLKQNYSATAAAAEACMLMAAKAFEQGRYAEAEQHLNWVVAQKNSDVIQVLAAQRLAIVQLQQQKFDAALATLSRPLEASFLPWLAETKGDILSAKGQKFEAAAAYDEALANLPLNDDARRLLEIKKQQLD